MEGGLTALNPVNFFGHAVVASWHSSEPGFILGSMLPDFATMIGDRVPEVSHQELESGVDFHHATDRVFHDSPTFRRLEREARGVLRELGVSRPSALAIGHIGVEMLLDASLATDEPGVAGYTRALSEGHGEALGAHIHWPSADGSARYEQLRSVLVARGVFAGSVDPRLLAMRVSRALAPRPRLRLEPGADILVEEWVRIAAPGVREAAPALIEELALQLHSSRSPKPVARSL